MILREKEAVFEKLQMHKPDVSTVEHNVSQFMHSLCSKTFLLAKLQHFYEEKLFSIYY